MIISNLFIKKFKLIIIVVSILFLISVISIYFISKSKRNQMGIKKSLEEGFGYYGDEESLGCFSKTGKCTTEGEETTIQYCKPHPQTGNGCIDEDGDQTFSTIVRKRPCKTQCFSSKFTVEDGVRVVDPSENYLGTNAKNGVVSAGCDNIIDKKFGIDYSSYFLRDFDKSTLKYELKRCIPNNDNSMFQGYYQKVSTCLSSDSKGDNSCKIICGRDSNILNLNGFANSKLNSNLINYYPTEINEEGEIRNVCYDINNVDQVEVLNYPGNIPEDFIYPNKCYKHTNVKDFDVDIWPTSDGENIFQLNKAQISSNISYIDFTGKDADKLTQNVFGKIITEEYDLNNNQNSYVKVKIGNETALLEKVYTENNTGLLLNFGEDNESNIETNTYYLYLDLTSEDYPRKKLKYFLTDIANVGVIEDLGGNNIFEEKKYFEDNTEAYTKSYFIDSGEKDLLIPCSILNFFTPIKDSYYLTKDTTKTYIKTTSSINIPELSTGQQYYFYIIAKNNTTNINQHILKKGDVTKEIITFDGTDIFDTYDNIIITSLYAPNQKLINLISDKVTPSPSVTLTVPQLPGNKQTFLFKIDFEKSFFTSTVFIKNEDTTAIGPSVAAKYEYIEIKKDVNELDKNGQPYSVLATSLFSNTIGYNYPLYLESQIKPGDKPEDYPGIVFSEFPKVKFYTPSAEIYQKPVTNYYFRPPYFENKDLKNFNEEILTASSLYTNNYININDEKNYFLTLTESINSGENYEEGKLYYLYNKNFSNGYNLKSSGVMQSDLTEGVSSSMAVICNANVQKNKRTVKIIRGNSELVSGGTGSVLAFTDNQTKVMDYFEMIKYQNFSSNFGETLIFEPEKQLGLIADYSVFKSPYTVNQDLSKNFLCYDERGRPRPEGYVVEVTTNGPKVFTNIACPNDNVKYEVDSDNPFCGVKGIPVTKVGDNTKIVQRCSQGRNNKTGNFLGTSASCIISNNPEQYSIVNNQLSFGLQLINTVKGEKFLEKINGNFGTFPSYFTKTLIEDKVYGPGEEFYIEKEANNYYVSLTNFNDTFVDTLEKWTRIFIFENHTYISPYEYFFTFLPPIIEPSNTNLTLGKYSNTYLGLSIQKSHDNAITFNSETSGINSQNYSNQGITYFYGSCRRGIYNFTSTDQRNDIDKNYIENLRIGSYRVDYNSLTVSNPRPGYTSLKIVENSANTLQNENPIFSLFDVVKLEDRTVFTSKFYDPNLETPWSTQIKPGDLFNPDFSYFNSFIYSYLIGYNVRKDKDDKLGRESLDTYGLFGTEVYTEWYTDDNFPGPGILSENFLFPTEPPLGGRDSYFTVTDKDIENFANNNISIKPGEYTTTTESTDPDVVNVYNTPEISDYILFIPKDFITINRTTKANNNFGPQPYIKSVELHTTVAGNDISYFTPLVKRIKEIETVDEGNPDVTYMNIIFEKKNYTIFTNKIATQYYLFNLGKENTIENLISRTFIIQDIGTDIIIPKDSNGNSDNGNQYEKKFIEFKFEIESISQEKMNLLFSLCEARKAKIAFDNKQITLTGVGNKQCYNNTLFNSSTPKDVLKKIKNKPSDDYVCFAPGCMPGDDGGLGNRAICYGKPDGNPGWTSFECPGAKWWYCPATDFTNDTFSFLDKGNNFLTSALSARYIKTSFQSPYYFNPTGKTYACLNSSTPNDMLKTKVTGMCTEVAFNMEEDDKSYYFNEFREDKNYFEKQIPVTFSVGDTFIYYSELGDKNSGNKKFEKGLEFRVTGVGVTVKNKNANLYGTVTGEDLYLNYDYKCTLVSNKDPEDVAASYFKIYNISYKEQEQIRIKNPLAKKFKRGFNIYLKPQNISKSDNFRYWKWCPLGAPEINVIFEYEDPLDGQRKTKLFPISSISYYKSRNNFHWQYSTSVIPPSNVPEYKPTVWTSTASSGSISITPGGYYSWGAMTTLADLKDITFDPTKPYSLKIEYNNITTIYVSRGADNQPSITNDHVTLSINYSTDAGHPNIDGTSNADVLIQDLDKFTLDNPTFLKPAIDAPPPPYNIFKNNNLYYVYGFNWEKVSAGWRYAIPYTIGNYDTGNRLLLQGYDKNFKAFFSSNLVWSPSTAKSRLDKYKITQSVTDIDFDNFYLDAYKFNDSKLSQSQSTGMISSEAPLDSILYSGLAIRNGILDTIVLTGTNLVSDLGKEAYVNVTVSGKPYGVGFFPSSPQSENTIINYDAFGKIEDFKFQNISEFPINTILKSKHGFQIKFLSTPPPIYTFKTIESPSGEILPYTNDFSYAEGEIVNVKNKNLKQYYRNISSKAIPYQEKIDVESKAIPFAFQNTSENSWEYPVYKNQIEGTFLHPRSNNGTPVYQKEKLLSLPGTVNTTKYLDINSTKEEIYDNLSSFQIVNRSTYPENNFVEYDISSFYGLGDIARGTVSGKDRLYRSLIPKNQGNDLTDTDKWELVDLTENLISLYDNQFYSKNITDDNFLEYITEIKNLDNQNLPALIETNFNNDGTGEFCPLPCTLYNLSEKYTDSFLQNNYFEDIKYLFTTPVLLLKEGTSFFVSLGNTPVKKSEYYNTGFLQDGGARTDFLSQYLYFINIKDEEYKYDKPLCTGNLSITTKDDLQETHANKFEFSNGLLFNFLPCDIDSQDFIKYEINKDITSGTSFKVSSSSLYPNSSTPNVFPPYGVSCHVLISSNNNTSFTSSYGHFEFSYGIKDEVIGTGDSITLKEEAGTSYVTISNRTSGRYISQDIILTGQEFNYGDIWYLDGGEDNQPFGFVVPEEGKITPRSLIQLNKNSDYDSQRNKIHFIPGISLEDDNVINPSTVFDFTVTKSTSDPSFNSGNFKSTDSEIEYYIKFEKEMPLQKNTAIFYGDTPIEEADNIYLPSYDIQKNIKAQGITVFGENFVGDLNYSLNSNNANYSIEGDKRSTMVFNEFRNDLLLTDIDKRKSEVFAGDKTINLENLYKTFIINFENDTFSLKPNLFSSPITSPINKFLYSSDSSVDPTLPISVINTESTNILISESMSTLKGVSVNINFDEFLEYNTSYTTDGTKIPGKSNLQVQLSEIRQNLTDKYIDDSNNCNIYFQPIVGTKPSAYTEAKWNITYKLDSTIYKSSLIGARFSGDFTNKTVISENDITFYLGCNLSYIFNQSDSSNPEPMVFSTKPFENEGSITSTSTISNGKKLVLEYFINNEKVENYDTYKNKFNSSASRFIKFFYQGEFTLKESDYNDAFIYYGTPTNGSSVGGKIKINYH